jgi:hypothetical protein
MCSNVFYVAGGLRAFITGGQAYDKKFDIMVLSGYRQDIMLASDVIHPLWEIVWPRL